MAGLTEKGYRRRTYNEILSDKIQKAKNLFGEDIDTAENTVLGKYLRINAYDQEQLEEQAELIYYSVFPNSAFGQSLDRLCTFVGITREPAYPSVYRAEVTGTPNYIILSDFLVETDTKLTFHNTGIGIIGANGKGSIQIECDQAGEIGNVHVNEIKNIVNPVTEITGITVTERLRDGSEMESDSALRARFSLASQGLGSCNENSIRAALLRIPEVESVGIVVNDTDTEDSDGRPAKSFECYISGGNNKDQEIAKTIFEKKPLGIKTCGSTTRCV